MCDVDDAHSCTSVFRSKYGKGFGVIGDLMGDQVCSLKAHSKIHTTTLQFLYTSVCIPTLDWSHVKLLHDYNLSNDITIGYSEHTCDIQKHPLNQPNSVYGLIFYSLGLLLFVCAGQRYFYYCLCDTNNNRFFSIFGP